MRSRRVWIMVIVPTIVLAAGSLAPLFAQAKKAPNSKAGTPSRGSVAEQPADRNGSLQDALVRKLKEALDSAADDEVSDEDRNTANRILGEADGILTRIREENRRALEQVNRQVRIADGRSPNVVLFLLHDVGYGDLGCYGQQEIRTPVMDLIAAHGTRFTQFYAGAPESVASRGTLLSGKLTARGTQVGDTWVTVREQDWTLAEMLYQGGYETGLFGVWGAGPAAAAGHPNSQGFKTFFGYLDDASAADYYPETLWQNGEQIPLSGNQGGTKTQYAPDLIVESAKRFIDSKDKRPFFLMIAFPMAMSGDGSEVPDFGIYADKNWPTADKARAAMFTRVDGYIGQVVRKLCDRGLISRTITVVTSDSGSPKVAEDRFQSTAGLRGWQGELYEGGIRVPLIVHWSSCFRLDCCESDLPFGMWDALPTLADLTGTWRRPKAIDGVSVVRSLRDKPDAGSPSPGSPLYWEKHSGGFGQAVRLDNWKAVRPSADGPWELYDLRTDPAEAKDVSETHADVVERVNKIAEQERPK